VARASFWIVLTTALLVAGFLLLPRFLAPPMLGHAYVWLVLLYHVVLMLGVWLRSHHEVFDAWLFLLPLSLFLVVPGWVLAREFGVLVFPQLGGERLGPVPAYMAGLWVAPLLVVLWLAEIVHRRSAVLALAVAALVAATVFGLAEWAARGQSLWVARNVATFQGVALYALAAETLLGIAAWLMFAQVQGRALPLKILGAAVVSMFYLGAAVSLLFAFRRFGIG
jgi:hypothetical protein